MTSPDTVTVAITRTVRVGCEAEFERALHDFVQRSLLQPGQLGVHVMRPAPGSSSREYSLIRKFASRDHLTAFRDSPEYLAWQEAVRLLTDGEGHVEELCGLESWFTLQGERLTPLPKWKMATATFLGVFPTATGLNLLIGPLLRDWPFILASACFNACVVILLTWLVMPLITRLLHRWLHSDERNPRHDTDLDTRSHRA